MNDHRLGLANLPVVRALRRSWIHLRLAARARPWPLELPVVVQFPVNDICDSKCQMCNIWQQRLDRQLSVDEVRRVFSDPLFRRVTAIGFNGGEPTLRNDLAEIAGAVSDAMPSLKTISVITNGLNSKRAIARIDEVASRLEARGIGLDVMVSLDGVGDVHDRVRGAPGNFDQACQLIRHIRERWPSVTLRIGCTIIRDNAFGLHELLDYCRSQDLYVKFRLGVRHKRLYNLTGSPAKTIGKRTWINTHPFELSDEEHWHVGQFLLGVAKDYEPSLLQRQFYLSLADQILYGKQRRAGCDWQHRGVTVSSRGELMYCAVQSDALGDVRQGGADDVYFGKKEHLEQILRDKCATCAHDYVGQPGGRQQLDLLVDSLSRSLGLTSDRVRRIPGHGMVRRIRSRRAARAMMLKRQHLATLRPDEHPASDAHAAPILICGWYGTETLGDKAILAATVSAIRRVAPTHQIHVASLNATLTRLTVAEMPELRGCDVLTVEEALAEVGHCRALVFGGGPLMAISEMAEMEALFALARAARVPSLVSGCGVGPVGAGPYRDAIASLLKLADARIFRDEASRLAARELGIDVTNDEVCEDPAFSWLATGEQTALPAVRRNGLRLALGLRDWPYRQYAPTLPPAKAESIRQRFESTLVESLDALLERRPELTLVPIPFCTHDAGGDDRLLYWRLARRSHRIRSAMDTSGISRDLGPHGYRAIMRDADACLAMRFHSIVFGAGLGKPLVALDYTLGEGKSHAIAKRLAVSPLPIDRVTPSELLTALEAALDADTKPAALAPLGFFDAFARRWNAVFA